jgi:hypothetical protein
MQQRKSSSMHVSCQVHAVEVTQWPISYHCTALFALCSQLPSVGFKHPVSCKLQ